MSILITGANRGIGLELTIQYSQDNHVYAFCRHASSKLLALPNVTVIDSVDVTCPASIKAGIARCNAPIDLLINNAGILQRVGLIDMDDIAITKIKDQFLVNALAPLLVVSYSQQLLTENAKVAIITSRMGSIADNDSGGHYGYRMSKAAVNMAAKSLAIDLKDSGVAVGIIHPGWVQTDMTGHTGHYTVQQSAQQIMDRITDLNLSNSGSFWHSDGQELPW